MSIRQFQFVFALAILSSLARAQVNLTPEQLFPAGNAAWTPSGIGVTGTVAFKLLVEQSGSATANSLLFDVAGNGFPGGVGTSTDDVVIFKGADIPGKIVTVSVPPGANLALFHDITNSTGVFLSGPDGILDIDDAYLNSNPALNYTRVGPDQLVKYYGANQFTTYQYTSFGQTVHLGTGYVAFIFIEEDHTPNYDYNDMIIGVLPPCLEDANCDDGLFCNGVEHCTFPNASVNNGVCVGGTPPVCNDGVACTFDECKEQPGGYTCLFKPHDQDCDDHNFCNGLETCDPVAGCVQGKPVDCDDGVPCTIDTCIDKGLCAHTPDNSYCDDGNFCNGTETCNRKKGCQAGPPPVCNDGVGCTVDVCNPQTGRCEYTPNNSCDDGQFCNGVETCDPVHGCQAGAPPNCDDGIACTRDLCSPQTNSCQHVPDDSLCSNGLFCDGTEICNPTAGCGPGTPPNCDDDIACTTDSCDEANDACLHVPQTSACDDGLFCDGQETCDPVVGCQNGPPPCAAGLACNEPNLSCDQCLDNTACDDHKFCNGREVCQNGVCIHVDPPSCNDSVACTIDRCDPVTDVCVHAPDNSLCNNGLFCDGVEVCNPQTGCQPGTPVNCNDGVACTTDLCVEATDQCTHTPNNSFCNDGLFCNGTEVCHPTQGCLPGTPPNCNDSANCSVDTCNEANDRCDHACSTPQITCTNQQFECDNVGTFLPPVVNNPCSTNPTATCNDVTTPGKIPQEYTVTRSCSFTNDCGNSATCQQEVKVVDTTPPHVTCPPDKRFECDAIGDFGQPTVSDNCNPHPNVTVSVQEITGDCTPPETAGISPPPKLIKLNTYTVSDGTATLAEGSTADGSTTGNTATCTQRIEIIDTHAPLILTCPATVSGCTGEPLNFTPPNCHDSCGTCSVLCTRSDGLALDDPVSSGPLTIHCVAHDECENPSAPCDVSVAIEECDHNIPTVSQWGLVVLALLLLIVAKLRFTRIVKPTI